MNTENEYSRGQLTLIEGILLLAAIVLVILFLIIMFKGSGLKRNEAAAISALRQISSAEELYNTVTNPYGTMEELERTRLIDYRIAEARHRTSPKDGYYFTLALDNWRNWWCCIARPVTWGVTGTRNFKIGTNGVIYYNEQEDSSVFTIYLEE